MFKLREENRMEVAQRAKTELENLVSLIPELKEMEVGIDTLENNPTADFVLTSVFDDTEGLKTYAGHPEHVKVVAFLKPHITSRVVVDYEI